MIKDKIAVGVTKALRILMRGFAVFPVKKNRVIFNSFLGSSYSCNPKYVCMKLREKYGDQFEIVWAFKEPEKVKVPRGIKKVKYKTPQWIYYEWTASASVGNNGGVWIPRRKGQLKIDTWHGGGCYKRVGTDRELEYKRKKRLEISSREINLYLSSSRFFSDYVVRESFGYKGEILECGMPRNDLLVAGVSEEKKIRIRSKICRRYQIEEDQLLVLFAPTWREFSERAEFLDAEKVRRAVSQKYRKKVKLLGRGHPSESNIPEEGFVDVTGYPDMQELLLIADILISDYSSCIWDYSFTGKPCFLFAPDLEEYRKKPGFDRDIMEWGFPVCRSNEELTDRILDFRQEEYEKKMKAHQESLGCCETGRAADIVAERIAENSGIKV